VAERGCPIGIMDDGDGVDVPIITYFMGGVTDDWQMHNNRYTSKR
jgi:hypothetical protein